MKFRGCQKGIGANQAPVFADTCFVLRCGRRTDQVLVRSAATQRRPNTTSEVLPGEPRSRRRKHQHRSDLRLDHLPRPGETMLAGDVLTVPGGKGANQAVAAARVGGQVRMVARLSADPFGHSLPAAR